MLLIQFPGHARMVVRTYAQGFLLYNGILCRKEMGQISSSRKPEARSCLLDKPR